MHPHHHVSFDQWIGKIAEKIKTGETYKRTNENHYYDAMPACWKKMNIEDRRKVLDIIDGFEDSTDDDTFGWSKENVHKLLPFCKLADIPKLRICHKVARETGATVVGGNRNFIAIDEDEDEPIDVDADKAVNVDDDDDGDILQVGTKEEFQKLEIDSFMFKPRRLCVEDFQTNGNAQKKLFSHMIDFASRQSWKDGKREVSRHLDVHVPQEQHRLFNPQVVDTITGFIMQDAKGEVARLRLPARLLNVIDGNISSWCSVLNSRERLNPVTKTNRLAMVLGDIEKDKQEDKEGKEQKAKEEDAEKKRKEEEKKKKYEEDQEVALRVVPSIFDKVHRNGIDSLVVSELRLLIRFKYNDEEGEKTKHNKRSLIEILRKHMSVPENVADMPPLIVPETVADMPPLIVPTAPGHV